MCKTKAVLFLLSINSLVAASSCIHQVHTENKEGQHNEIKLQSPCENEYISSWLCLNAGEGNYSS